MNTVSQYDLLDMIRQKCNIIGDDDKSKPMDYITKINAFILFRAMWYCDEVHDFCSLRSGYDPKDQEYFASERFRQMKEDNEWYFNTILKSDGIYNKYLNFNKDNIINNILNNPAISNNKKYILRLYFSLDKNNNSLLPSQNQEEIYFLREINDLKDYDTSQIEQNYDIIPDLRTSKKKLNQTKAKYPYITSNNLAHSITSMIRHHFFRINNISFNDLLDCKYEYDFYKASIISSNLLSLLTDNTYSKKTNDATLYLNIDPTGSGATLSPLHYSLWKYTQQNNCNTFINNKEILKNLNKNLKELNKTNDELIFSQSNHKEQPNLKLLITQANIWDASNDDELTSIAKKDAKIPIVYAPTTHINNINFKITFGSPIAEFLQYIYSNNDNNIQLQVLNFCGKSTNLPPFNAGTGSVSTLAKIIAKEKNFSYTVYKTCGDFLQFFTLALYERLAINDDKIIYSMLSQDLTGIDIGSLFCFNMIGCIHSGNKLKGLQMLLPKIVLDQLDELKENDPNWYNFMLDIVDPTYLKDISKTIGSDYFNKFGKYKLYKTIKKIKKNHINNVKKRKISKIKKNNLISSAKKLGISYKNKSKEKLEKHINKVIQMAKKYRIKLNKDTIKNIKNAIKIHKIAKNQKIKLTKRNKNNKRVYKTPNQLLREINKNK